MQPPAQVRGRISLVQHRLVDQLQIAGPEYPWGEKELAPGRCVRGWITFPVPAKKRPVFVEYAAESETVPPRWRVK
ncbi:hypothetical protein [Micromonospora sp. NPDC005161]